MEESEITTHGATVEEWTRALAESTGAPGGGAGTGLMLAVAASLASMVAGYSKDDGGEPARIQERAQALRREALGLADEDASASKAFGAAFRLEPGAARDDAIRLASVDAAAASAVLGERAMNAIDDLAWLATNGNRALVADVVVAFGALRAAVAGARTNVSFDLGSLRSAGTSLEQVHQEHPELWSTVERLNAAMERIDGVTAAIDHRAAPRTPPDCLIRHAVMPIRSLAVQGSACRDDRGAAKVPSHLFSLIVGLVLPPALMVDNVA